MYRVSGVIWFGLATAVAAVAAEAPKLQPEQAATVMAQIDADVRLRGVFAMCPADAYARDAPFYADYVKPRSRPLAECAAAPTECYRRCLEAADPGACFGLARAFQENEPAVDRRYAQMLFAMACDVGQGAGCTNRAASMRNAPIESDATLQGSKTAMQRCEHRSFAVACTQGDAWGCSMLGQTFELGEGTPVSTTQARRYYQKSCSINPDFPSCDFAKVRLGSLDGDATARGKE